jgi:hypothetical protein
VSKDYASALARQPCLLDFLQYACWAELLLVQLMVPDASFFGHLCGILAGAEERNRMGGLWCAHRQLHHLP